MTDSRLIHISSTDSILVFFMAEQYAIGLPCWLSGKESSCQCRRRGFHPWIGKILWRSKWQPTPVFLPGKSHGQRSLAGYSPWGHKRVRHNLMTNQQQQMLHCIYVINLFLSISLLMDIRLLPCPGYRHNHWSACVSLSYGFLRVYAQEWDCWLIR